MVLIPNRYNITIVPRFKITEEEESERLKEPEKIKDLL